MLSGNWRDPLCLAFVLIGVSATCAPERPNFVLIMCDDLGWGDVGFNGNTVIQTPHLDQMAANSLRFTRFYAASAVCSPTRGSVVTTEDDEFLLFNLLDDRGETTDIAASHREVVTRMRKQLDVWRASCGDLD